jgi:hypothetical protein
MARRAENASLYDTINTFLNDCLISDKSLLWPNKKYWTLDILKSLKRHMIDAPEYGSDLSFEEKLEKQLMEASEAEWAMICDIYYVYFLPSINITLGKIMKDIGWAASKASIILPDASDPLWKVQANGFTRTAIKYHIKYSQFWFIILFALYVKEHDFPESVIQKHAIMRHTMDMVLENIENRADRAYDMRHAILYMAFPDQYERIISTRDKQQILDTYQNQVKDPLPADLDDSLLLIRAELGKEYDKPDRKFDFYTDLKDEWKPGPPTPPNTITVDTDKGVLTIPVDDADSSTPEDAAKGSTAHTKIQWLLLKLGNDMGLDLWVANNDRNKVINGQRFTDLPRLKKTLPLTFDEETNKTIQLIDVLWLKQTSILAAFEIESTTSIYSGILRMADLIAMQPNINIPLYIVAPDARRAKVYSEINRPVFSNLPTPMNTICKYISFSALRSSIEKAGSMIKYLKPEFLDDIAEVCDVYQNE